MPSQVNILAIRSGWRRVGLLVVVTLLYFPLLEVVRVTAGPNFHEVTPGRLYRSAQLSAAELRTVSRRFGVKTIINLRNACPVETWYQDETAVARERGIEHHDLNFSAYLAPAPQELRKLVSILETCPRPVLIHCRRGADRTGLATSLAWWFDQPEAAAPETALLSWRFGHVAVGKVTVLDRVLGEYGNWLQHERRGHSREALKRWVNEIYRPGPGWAKIDPLALPEHLPLGQPAYAKFRVQNLSDRTWTFHPSGNRGIHLRGYLEPKGAQPPPGSEPFAPPAERRLLAAGFFHATVPPGGSLDLEVALPAMPQPGQHTLFVDLFDEENDYFFHMVGSASFHTILETARGSVARQ